MIVLGVFSQRDLQLVRRYLKHDAAATYTVQEPTTTLGYRYSLSDCNGHQELSLVLLDGSLQPHATTEQHAAHIGAVIGEARAIAPNALQFCTLYHAHAVAPAVPDTPPVPVVLGAVREQNKHYYSDIIEDTDKWPFASADIADSSAVSRSVPTAVALAKTAESSMVLRYQLTAASALWWRVSTALLAPHQQVGFVIDAPYVDNRTAYTILQKIIAWNVGALEAQPQSRLNLNEQQLIARQIIRWSLSEYERHQFQQLIASYHARHGTFPAELLHNSQDWHTFRHAVYANGN